jgi:hypothetical protein
MIATYAEEAYERDIVERKMFGRSRFLVNEPGAIKHVLLDNAQTIESPRSLAAFSNLASAEGSSPRKERRGGGIGASCRPPLTTVASRPIPRS